MAMSKTVYLILNKKTSKRLRMLDGELSPAFQYPQQAFNYLDIKTNNSKYYYIKKVG